MSRQGSTTSATPSPTLPQRSRSGNWHRLRRRLRLRASWSRYVAIAFIILLMSYLVLLSATVSQMLDSWQQLERTLILLADRPPADLTLDDLDDVQHSLQNVRQQADNTLLLARPLTPIRQISPDFRSLLTVLETASSLAQAADDMTEGVRPVLFFLTGDDDTLDLTGVSSTERVIDLLTYGQEQFLSAQSHLETATQHLKRLDASGITPDTLRYMEQANRYHDRLLNINHILLDSPDLLRALTGSDEPTTFLILAQNNDEIRPSGGFISTYGWLTVRNGRLSTYNYRASTPETPRPPPSAFIENLNIPDWWIQYEKPVYVAWDGSPHADFPRTAQMAADYYAAGYNPGAPVDGVLAIDVSGFEFLLRGMGNVEIPGYNRVINHENFRDVVYDIRAEGQRTDDHKAFVAAAYRAILQHWTNAAPETLDQLPSALLEALQQKHILIYSMDPVAQRTLERIGWAGAQTTPDNHDYVMVADANLSGNKSNRSILRALTLDVTLTPDDTVRNHLSVQYDYQAALASEDPAVNERVHGPLVYLNLMQVFVPPTAVLLSSDTQRPVQTITDDDHKAFVTRVRVDYNGAASVDYDYETTGIIETIGDYRRYRLLIQKQPGTHPATQHIRLTLPAGASLISSLPDVSVNYDFDNPVLDFRLEQTTDTWIEIIYRPA